MRAYLATRLPRSLIVKPVRDTRSSSREAESREQHRPPPDEAPELDEEQLADPSPGDLSRADYVAILKRAVRQPRRSHHQPRSRPRVLRVPRDSGGNDDRARGLQRARRPDTIQTVVDKLGTVAPAQATDLIKGSLTRMSENASSGFTVLAVGLLVATWSVTGAMQNLMWALNLAYDRDESRGFVRRRVVALGMLTFASSGSS